MEPEAGSSEDDLKPWAPFPLPSPFFANRLAMSEHDDSEYAWTCGTTPDIEHLSYIGSGGYADVHMVKMTSCSDSNYCRCNDSKLERLYLSSLRV